MDPKARVSCWDHGALPRRTLDPALSPLRGAPVWRLLLAWGVPLGRLNSHHQIHLNLDFTMSSQGKLEGKVAIVTGKQLSP